MAEDDGPDDDPADGEGVGGVRLRSGRPRSARTTSAPPDPADEGNALALPPSESLRDGQDTNEKKPVARPRDGVQVKARRNLLFAPDLSEKTNKDMVYF
jgi:hypothetical protein